MLEESMTGNEYNSEIDRIATAFIGIGEKGKEAVSYFQNQIEIKWQYLKNNAKKENRIFLFAEPVFIMGNSAKEILTQIESNRSDFALMFIVADFKLEECQYAIEKILPVVSGICPLPSETMNTVQKIAFKYCSRCILGIDVNPLNSIDDLFKIYNRLSPSMDALFLLNNSIAHNEGVYMAAFSPFDMLVDMVSMKNYVGFDFSDIKGMLITAGVCFCALGRSTIGDNAIQLAVERMLNQIPKNINPDSARWLLLNAKIDKQEDISIFEINTIVENISDTIPSCAPWSVYGATPDERVRDEIQVHLIVSLVARDDKYLKAYVGNE